MSGTATRREVVTPSGNHVTTRPIRLHRKPDPFKLVADKGYNTNAFRSFLKEQGIETVSPGKSNRKKRVRHDKEAYKGRNVVERSFCRLKDWRRIATRYDKLARNFLSALCFVAMLAYRL
jgi:transposase